MKLRRILIVALAAAFSLAGVARGIAAYEHCADPRPAMTHDYGHHHAHADHAMGNDHGTANDEPGDSHGQAADKCVKCCGVCVAAPSINVNAPASPAAPTASTIFFPADTAAIGHLLSLDPGIPKRS